MKANKLKSYKTFVFDFDGVMTNNKVFVFEDGKEAVLCNRADGFGVGILKSLDIKMLILSTEKNKVVLERAKKLNLEVINASNDKASDLTTWANTNNLLLEDICYIGNDLNDYEVMKKVGYSIAPADAYSEILDIADFITNAKGGDGVIREIAHIMTE